MPQAAAPTALQLVQSNSLPALVQTEIEQLILRGELAIGQRINESDLASRFGMSRGPIREALRRLAGEGLVLTGPTGRTYVARLSIQDLDEVHSLRAIFEHLAVEYACRNATAAHLAELQSVINTMAAQLREGLDARAAAEASGTAAASSAPTTT